MCVAPIAAGRRSLYFCKTRLSIPGSLCRGRGLVEVRPLRLLALKRESTQQNAARPKPNGA